MSLLGIELPTSSDNDSSVDAIPYSDGKKKSTMPILSTKKKENNTKVSHQVIGKKPTSPLEKNTEVESSLQHGDKKEIINKPNETEGVMPAKDKQAMPGSPKHRVTLKEDSRKTKSTKSKSIRPKNENKTLTMSARKPTPKSAKKAKNMTSKPTTPQSIKPSGVKKSSEGITVRALYKSTKLPPKNVKPKEAKSKDDPTSDNGPDGTVSKDVPNASTKLAVKKSIPKSSATKQDTSQHAESTSGASVKTKPNQDEEVMEAKLVKRPPFVFIGPRKQPQARPLVETGLYQRKTKPDGEQKKQKKVD